MNRFGKRLAIFGILVLTMAVSMDASATIISLQGEAEADRGAPTRTAPPTPTAPRSIASMVESDIAGRQKPKKSWAARIAKPPVLKNRSDTTLETIMAEIAADKALKSGSANADADRWNARPANTDGSESWTIVIPPRPTANPSAELNGPIATPWSDLSGLQSLATSSKWLLSSTSDYFNDKKQNVVRTVTGRSYERPRSTTPVSVKNAQQEGSKIPAYLILLVIIIAFMSFVMMRARP